MKLLYFTDVHLRGTNPLGRIDDFYNTSLDKLREIISYANENKIDYVLHGGDLFDRPDTAIKPSSQAGRLLSSFDMPVYTIVGNHDIYGYNKNTLERSMMGLFISLNILRPIPKEGLILKKDDLRVQVFGTDFSLGIDKSPDNYVITEDMIDQSVHKVINVCHGFLIDKPFVEGVDHTLIGEISHTRADLTLAGHYHSGFMTQSIDGKVFANPGSLLRISRSQREVQRRPKFIEINITQDKIDLKDIYLKSAKAGEEVFDMQIVRDSQFRQERMMVFADSIRQDVDLDQMDLENIALQIADSENLSDKVKEEAKLRLDMARRYSGE